MNLFVYGTLLFPEINRLVGGRSFETCKATITGYGIYRVKGANFPGIVSQPNTITPLPGLILRDVSKEEAKRFDQYEDGFYQRITETAYQSDSNETIEVDLYHVPTQHAEDILSSVSWSAEWFENNHKKQFLQQLRATY